MHLNIYDIDLNRVGELQTWVSLTWAEEYNDLGSITLEVVQTEQLVRMLKPWRYVTCDTSDQVMLILSVQVKDNHIVCYGKSALEILNRRTSDTVFSGRAVENIIYELVTNAEPFPYLTVEITGLQDRYDGQISGGQLWDYAKTVCQACDVGIRIQKDASALKIHCYKPLLNPDAKYALAYGNMGDISRTISDMQYYNVAMVRGAGEGSERITVYAGDTSATGADRMELYVDARDVQVLQDEPQSAYEYRLRQRGLEKLREHHKIDTIDFAIDTERAGLGDIISVKAPEYGFERSVRITSRTITSEYNGTRIELGFGELIKR